ncbi:unnamed protein product [Chondrus crispus]|uniref:C2H2-type domain-containing protein n=1 Tax=Chondrus crispus TaxID=2769 RepID=R7QCI9_CHOCR|nr:unnamed protein product [Chondrus crispus]CDF36227.1 unnamed protein product [Chondrus crispus]|eukprot:XP_005716046.1 unnamed protein product [Chondrus crispus]
MTLCEKPAICQFCRVRGIKTCECPASFKWRAPTKSAVPVPLAHAPFANAADTTLRIAPPAPEGRAGHSLAAWQNHTKRIFAVNTSGAFFVDWYKKSPDGSKMSRFMSPVHPVSYQFVCGTKQQTDSLASFYVTRMARCERATSADSRLYGSLSRGSHIGMIVDKINHQHMDTDPSHLQDVVTYFDTETPKYPMSAYPHVQYDQQVFTTSGPQSFGDVSSTNPSLDSDDFVPSPAMPLQDPHALHNTPKSTSTTITGDSSGLSNGDVASNSPYEFDNYKQPEYFMDDVVPSQDPNSLNAHGVHGLPEGASLSRNMPNNSNGNAQYMDKAGTLSTNDIKVQNLMTVDEANTPMCKKCNSTFLKRGNLGRHIQTVHLKLKPFQCDHCSQSFGYKNHLKRHQIIHQRGKDLKCRICSLQFKGQAQLTKHVQLEHQQGSPDSQGGYHSSVADRPHISCDDCGTRFSQRSNLVRHLHIHEGMRFPCPVCPSKSFGQRYDLRRHVSSKHPDYSGSQLASVAPQRVERVE